MIERLTSVPSLLGSCSLSVDPVVKQKCPPAPLVIDATAVVPTDNGFVLSRVERCWLRSANCQMAVVAVANNCVVTVPCLVNRLLVTSLFGSIAWVADG